MLYTGEQRGAAQRDAYREEINQALETPSPIPTSADPETRSAPGLRSHQVGERVIYHRVGDATVTVVRILHGRMDAVRHREE